MTRCSRCARPSEPCFCVVVDHLAASSPRFRARANRLERGGYLPALAVAFDAVLTSAVVQHGTAGPDAMRDAEELARALLNVVTRLRGEQDAQDQVVGAGLVARALRGDP